ncbi:hypothetical protein HOP50_18g82680 [Chloropicon primus]|nr:hypothetical protein HOP50_18g82680 [Chloropicon primus]
MRTLYSRAASVMIPSSFDEMKDTTVYVSQRSMRVLKGIALDRKKQVVIVLAFFVLAWTVSISSLRGRGAAYNQLKVSSIDGRILENEIEGVSEACSMMKEVSHDTVTSLPMLLCSNRLACGVNQDLSQKECDLYWKSTLQRGHIESIDLPKRGRSDKRLETIDEVIDFLEDQLNADKRMKLLTHMSMGYQAYMLPLPWNSKSVIQRDGYYTPDGRYVAYRVQGLGGGNTYAYFCDRILGFERVLPSSMRLMSAKSLERLLVQSLRNKARALTSSRAQKRAQESISRRASSLAKMASEEFKFNETHILVEMVSAIPKGVESNHVGRGSKSPLLDPQDNTFWEYVSMKTEGGLPKAVEDERSFAKISMDVVDMQLFDYIVGNDNRRYPSITFLGKDKAFLLVGDNLAAGSGADKTPPIKMPFNYETPNLYLGAIGCKFRRSTIERLQKIQKKDKRLSTMVRDAIAEGDKVYVQQYEALAHGWLMATLQHVDLLSNTDLDENLDKILEHVETCVEQYGTTRVYVNA